MTWCWVNVRQISVLLGRVVESVPLGVTRGRRAVNSTTSTGQSESGKNSGASRKQDASKRETSSIDQSGPRKSNTEIVENVQLEAERSVNSGDADLERSLVLDSDAVRRLARVFVSVLTGCRHRGAIEGCNVGFMRFCTKLLNCREPELHNAPGEYRVT